jgi:hypothetical protein
VKRDIVRVPINNNVNIVMASDNSGGIGLREQDVVKVPYEIVSYFSLRVAAMECMAAGATPVSVVIHNFCQDAAWANIVKGVEKGLKELELTEVKITGSTESNIPLLQSALGVVVVGKEDRQEEQTIDIDMKKYKVAVIGLPLVGDEVIENEQDVLPLSLFLELTRRSDLIILPVGSKGIYYELRILLNEEQPDVQFSEVDLYKTSGPSTCVLIAFPEEVEPVIKRMTGHLYHSLNVR